MVLRVAPYHATLPLFSDFPMVKIALSWKFCQQEQGDKINALIGKKFAWENF